MIGLPGMSQSHIPAFRAKLLAYRKPEAVGQPARSPVARGLAVRATRPSRTAKAATASRNLPKTFHPIPGFPDARIAFTTTGHAPACKALSPVTVGPPGWRRLSLGAG